MIKNSLIILSFIIVFFSCKKDSVISLPPPNFPNTISTASMDTMLPLAIGNYWIYQKSTDDTSGYYSMTSEMDSVYVVKDTMVMGERRFKIAHSNHLSKSNLHY